MTFLFGAHRHAIEIAGPVGTTTNRQDQFDQAGKGHDLAPPMVSDPEPCFTQPAVVTAGVEPVLNTGGRAGVLSAHGYRAPSPLLLPPASSVPGLKPSLPS